MKLSYRLFTVATATCQMAMTSAAFSANSRHKGHFAHRREVLSSFSCTARIRIGTTLPMAPESESNQSSERNEEDSGEGALLASEFFKVVQAREISFEGDELDFADAEDDEEFPDDPLGFGDGSDNITAAGGGDFGEYGDAIENYDDSYSESGESVEGQRLAEEFYRTVAEEKELSIDDSENAKPSSLTNKQIYSEVRDRVLESAGGFVELTKAASDDDGEGALTGGGEDGGEVKPYEHPTNVPDSGLTARDVVLTILAALRHNDHPAPNRGIEILFGYSSSGSQIAEMVSAQMLTPVDYLNFLLEVDENRAFFDHEEAYIEKADLSPDGLRAYITVRLVGMAGSRSYADGVAAQFILSTTGMEEEDCWLVDSMRIPGSKRGRRRRY